MLLISAVALAAWSRFGATQAEFNPGGYTMTTLVTAGALVALLALAAVLRRVDRAVPVIAALLTVIGAGYLLLRTPEFSADVRRALTYFLRSDQLTTAAAAWTMATAGAVLTAAGALSLVVRQPPRWTSTAVGSVVAVVLAIALTVTAFHFGDDSRFVDSTTASPTSTPPVPSTFGQQRFSVQISDQTARDMLAGQTSDVQLAVAGTGFVVAHQGRLTAYDSAGHERWHYHRTGPGDIAVSDFRVFDEGRTVILRVGGPLVALDATTGVTLWSATDADLSAAYDSPRGLSGAPGFFIARDEHRWVAFDLRTAKPLWSRDTSAACGGKSFPGPMIDAASRVVEFRWCFADQDLTVDLNVIDPQTGESTLHQQVLNTALPPDWHTGDDDIHTTRAGADGVAFAVYRRQGPPTQKLLDARSGQIVDLTGSVWSSTDAAGEFLVDTRTPGSSDADVALYGPQGTPKCRLPESLSPRDDSANFGPLSVWLDKQIVIENLVGVGQRQDIERRLQLFDRTSCGLVGEVPTAVGSDDYAMLAAPGAVLVLRADDSGTYVDGYA